ncbi:MAG: septum formation initiator family protein [Eubacteriales bacterium]|nr:septum formation initiator family protein [Eubacteriales bacterium]
MAAKKRKKNLNNRLSLIGITLVVCVLAVAVGVRSESLKTKEQTYLMREDTLNKSIEDEEERTEELNEKKVYVKTKEYIEEVAREKLGLVNPDEIILKENENE